MPSVKYVGKAVSLTFQGKKFTKDSPPLPIPESDVETFTQELSRSGRPQFEVTDAEGSVVEPKLGQTNQPIGRFKKKSDAIRYARVAHGVILDEGVPTSELNDQTIQLWNRANRGVKTREGILAGLRNARMEADELPDPNIVGPKGTKFAKMEPVPTNIPSASDVQNISIKKVGVVIRKARNPKSKTHLGPNEERSVSDSPNYTEDYVVGARVDDAPGEDEVEV